MTANRSSFETLSAFVWRARTIALKLHTDQRIKLLLVVNGRSRLNPRLPEVYFGNSVLFAHVLCSAGEVIEKPLFDTMRLVKEAIGMITNKYIRSTKDNLEVTRAKSFLAATVFISSWSRLSFNTNDFGWGVLIAYGRISFPQKEEIFFLPHGDDNKSVNVLAGLPVLPWISSNNLWRFRNWSIHSATLLSLLLLFVYFLQEEEEDESTAGFS
ncbi:hypothetical protein LguiB_004190 [Lonicera macranthoides]